MKARSVKAATLSLALLSACSGDTIFEAPITTEPPVVKAATHPILFSSNHDPAYKHPQIFAMKVDGSEMVNLSRNAFTETDPSWSPDGQQIALASNRGSGSDIYAMNVDGSGIRQLTNDHLDDRRPHWSPDGKKIAFESGKEGQLPTLNTTVRYSDIWVVDADGSHVTNITKTPGTSESWASWAPDGKTIVFSGPNGITIVNPDGTSSRRFHPIDPRYADDVAAWSPDGSRIAYSTFDKQSPFESDLWVIFTAKADGTDVKRLTLRSARFPAWSPDGTRIVYNGDGGNEFWARFGIVNVSVINADGSNNARLTLDDGRNELGGSQAWAK